MMDRLEADLRDELVRRVAAPPSLPGLAESTVRRGRRARRRRTTAAVGAGLAALAVGVTTTLPERDDRLPGLASVDLTGPPQVPLFVGPAGDVVDWPDGVQRTRRIGTFLPVAQVPAGLLVEDGRRVGVLGPEDTTPRILVESLASQGVAVAGNGGRATVAVQTSGGVLLHEVELPSGRLLRSTSVGPPSDTPVLPVTYSGDAVLVTVGEGEQQRVRLWEGNDDNVVGTLDGVRAVLGGGGEAPAGQLGARAAFRVDDSRCSTEIRRLINGDGDPWRLCREPFVGFSPDGEAVLATGPTGTGLVVRDADDGELIRSIAVPDGVRASAWEGDESVLHTTVDGSRTVIVRCAASSDQCREVASFPFVDRIPQPVRAVG